MFRLLLAAILVATAARASGEGVPQESEPEIDPAAAAGFSATVEAEKSVLHDPQAIEVLTRDDLQRSDGLFLEDSLNLVAGVRMESRTVSGGQRITIRGYGNGSNFNGTGYKAYLNGIPLTDAEGTTVLDDVDISTLGQVEVIKGPTSSLYGQGIGGVIRLSTLRPAQGTRASQELLGGSYGLLRSNTRVEHGSGSGSVLLNYGHQASDGYRTQSRSDKDYVLFSADYRPSSRQTLTTYAAYNHSYEQLAGQLTEDQFLNKENFAEPPYVANNGHVAIDSARLGISHKYEFARWLANTTSAYASGYQLNQPFAVGLSENLAVNAGGRTEFALKFGGPALGFTAVAGSEIQQTNAFKKSYGLTSNVLGALRGDLQVKALQSNTFAQATVTLPLQLSVTAGASLSFVRYAIQDRLANSANPKHADQSGVKTFDPVVTPRVAVAKAFGPDLSVYAQLSQGYSVPASGSVVIAQIGAVNKDLKPERGTLLEVGSKGDLLSGRLSYEAALFSLAVTDKLTPQAITGPTGTVLYTQTVNAGQQTDRGLELSASYAVLKDDQGPLPLLRVFGSYTWSHFRYDGFKSDNNNNDRTIDYSGNKVAGVPDHVFSAGLDAVSAPGVYLNATFLYTGAVPLTFDNAHSAKSQALLEGKIGYRRELPAKFLLDASAGAKNLTGSTYYTMVFLNANYSGAAPNVYLPGPGSPAFFAGVSLAKGF